MLKTFHYTMIFFILLREIVFIFVITLIYPAFQDQKFYRFPNNKKMVAEKNAPEVNETEDASTPQTPPTEPAAQQQLENSSNDLENEKPVAQGPRIRMRQKTPICAPKIDNSTPITVGDPAAALQRTMEALYEASPDMEDNNEGKLFFLTSVENNIYNEITEEN